MDDACDTVHATVCAARWRGHRPGRHLGSAGAQQAAQQAPVVALAPHAALDHAGLEATVPAVAALHVRAGAVQLRDELPVDVLQRVPVVQDLLAATLCDWLGIKQPTKLSLLCARQLKQYISRWQVCQHSAGGTACEA